MDEAEILLFSSCSKRVLSRKMVPASPNVAPVWKGEKEGGREEETEGKRQRLVNVLHAASLNR